MLKNPKRSENQHFRAHGGWHSHATMTKTARTTHSKRAHGHASSAGQRKRIFERKIPF